MRYRLRTLLLFVTVTTVASDLSSEAGEPIKPSLLFGKWKVVAAESVGRIDPNTNEEGKIWEFRETEIIGADGSHGIFRCPCKYDFDSKPMRVTYRNDPDDGFCARGIIRVEGDNLQLCCRIGLTEHPPEYPTRFKSEKDDTFMKMMLFSRITDEQ